MNGNRVCYMTFPSFNLNTLKLVVYSLLKLAVYSLKSALKVKVYVTHHPNFAIAKDNYQK